MESAAARAVNAAIAVMTRKMGLFQARAKAPRQIRCCHKCASSLNTIKGPPPTLGHKEPLEVEVGAPVTMAFILAVTCWRVFRRVLEAFEGPSRPGESHPEALTDSGREPLGSSGSCHRMKATAFPARPVGSSRTTEQSAPGQRLGTFDLTVLPLVSFPLPSPAGLPTASSPGQDGRCAGFIKPATHP
jgi:hypothetical protein